MLPARELNAPPLLLLVDDRPENLISLEAVLDDGRVRFLHANSGQRALELLLQHDVALVLLDVQMPEMDGYEVAQLMRGHSRTRNIPVIFITAHSREQQAILRAYACGAVDYIYKPFDSQLLVSKVHSLLDVDRNRRELVVSHQRIAETQAYYQAILQAASEGILVISNSGAIVYSNTAAQQMLEADAAQLAATRLAALFGHELCSAEQRAARHHAEEAPDGMRPHVADDNQSGDVPGGTVAADAAAEHSGADARIIADTDGVERWCIHAINRALRQHQSFRLHDALIFTCTGKPLPVSISGAPLPAPHDALVIVFQDVTAAKQLQKQLALQASTDNLTGLVNRSGFLHAVQAALSRVERTHKTMAVLYIDLDGFKRVNDSLGHSAGDKLLCEVATRLRRCMRPYDVLARVGGDEFTAILDSLNHPEEAARIAEKILDILTCTHEIAGVQVSIGASIGIASYPDCGSTADGLIRAADMAMYQAKAEGRNQYRFFTPAMNGRARARLMLEENLRTAIHDQQFTLHYQPQIDIASGRLRGFEALLRWTHPGAGIVSPALFMPLLEESGLINRLGPWIARAAGAQRQQWLSSMPDDLRLSINISARQFSWSRLVDDIAEMLQQTGLRGEQFEIEVTESCLIQDLAYAQSVLGRLRALGISIAMDDFGTGYSSLAYLRDLQVDALKIDQRFVAHILKSDKDAAIAKAIIQLAKCMGMEVIAEGVETAEQFHWLRENGCDTAQGFLFAPALSSADAARFTVQLPPPD